MTNGDGTFMRRSDPAERNTINATVKKFAEIISEIRTSDRKGERNLILTIFTEALARWIYIMSEGQTPQRREGLLRQVHEAIDTMVALYASKSEPGRS